MPSFQVPQFLDSGDKIIFNLNFRQFGYALGGFLISMAIFGIVGGINPTLGVYAFLPAVPVMLISAYAAFGRYNGRDADFYIVKFIIFVIKPKFMAFSRQPDNQDLNEKLNQYTKAKIEERWAARMNQSKKDENNPLAKFRNEGSQIKAEKVRLLGTALDVNLTNSSEVIGKQFETIYRTQQRLIQTHPQSTVNSNNYPQLPPSASIPSPVVAKNRATNFFDLDEDEAV
jgi:hypothetical protein